ncbi:phage portal protein [Polaromonas eurypsychrophila]|uniref:Phage portal protein n=1 Tax=Polaromonas eurypsychrophila TaxID=1614635 RepID=A0A916WJH6_9BURK|nr:phage portal protein [Polaromonas eurypsychrophila]GGB03690.1 phage portal protein [Polaromonas eurypsychrophila]
MSLITRALSAIGLERRSVSGGDPYWSNFASLQGGPVNAATAQGVSAVYACVSAISETIASLPLVLYRRDGEGRSPAPDHSLYRVLHDQANENQTALEFREWMQAAVLLRGNAFARIIRGNDGQVRELLPVSPDRVTVLRVGDKIAYDYTDLKGVVHRLLSGEVLHLRHRAGDDAVLGVSPIAAAKGVVELAISERDHGNATFKNGARLSGILKFPQTLKAEQRTALKNSWDSQYSGGANSGKTAILESGVEYQTVSMTLEDAEWIAARQFSVEEVARLFRVPPTVIGDLRHGNYSNSVEMARQFVTLTLKRHMVMWEQAIASKLLTEAGRRTYFAEHAVEGLLRGDSVNRADFYDKGISSGWLLPSEARRLENLPVIEGIDNAQRNQAA